MLTVTKMFEFDSAHFLPHYEGACSRVHGHRWKLEIEVTGEVRSTGSQKGMIIDFSVLKKLVEKNVLSKLDHTVLNDTVENPTAEVLLFHINFKLKKCLPKWIKIVRLRLWETPTSYAELKT